MMKFLSKDNQMFSTATAERVLAFLMLVAATAVIAVVVLG